MSVEDVSDASSTKILIKSTDPNRQGLYYICATPQETHSKWYHTLYDLLQKQHDFLKAIQSPIDYQKKLNKDS